MEILNRFFIKLLFTFMLMVASQSGYGQLFKGEALVGGNLSQMEGDRVNGYKKIGFCGGLGLQFPFRFKPESETKPWALSMEIFFSQRGARQRNPNYNPADTTNTSLHGHKLKYLLQSNYVCLPFMLHYTDKERYTFGLGLSYNRLVSSKEIELDKVQTYDTIAHFKPYDLMFVLDLRCRIWQQLKAGFRFEYSVMPIRTRWFPRTIYDKEETRKQYNNTLSLYVVYVFNEKRTNAEKEDKKKERIYYY
jgi:hypothetical protein